MSFIDRTIENRPTTGEAPFELHECFFSRTDERGVIQAGNNIFGRVSGYEWNELIGAPHKRIRHPEMPKGVFWLLWDTIKRGRSMGAYVQNKAKDGLNYWVYAMVVPCKGGYISARFKPSSPWLATIQSEYAALLEAEQLENLTPEASGKRLLARLKELGFEKYHHFAAHTASTELLARSTGLRQKQDPSIVAMRSMLDKADTLKQQSEGLIQEFEAMRTIPHNLRVIASRIEPAGGPVTVLSQNYGIMSQSMSDWFAEHVVGEKSNFSSIKGAVNNCLYTGCLSAVMRECVDQFTSEGRGHGAENIDAEREILNRVSKDRNTEAFANLRVVKTEAERILHACGIMQRHLLGLSSTRVLCKIESARVPEAGETLTDIIDQLGAFQARISEKLDNIVALSNEISSHEFDADPAE
ncbi:PAS domain-containing protein [Parasedimentitalea maritima]|uniref:PAS domain-containing protein n=1 Tax=Parasedimentitalea maritima TaxID=2578117 RepID=A0A6A4R961_9RHOB|nr:PAS domain-containing protein [Zongyanglinia marina]KAE9628869.1 PAS domain-containing protein [Zongyanglinia marina]